MLLKGCGMVLQRRITLIRQERGYLQGPSP